MSEEAAGDGKVPSSPTLRGAGLRCSEDDGRFSPSFDEGRTRLYRTSGKYRRGGGSSRVSAHWRSTGCHRWEGAAIC